MVRYRTHVLLRFCVKLLIARFLLDARHARLRQTVYYRHNEIGDHDKDENFKNLTNKVATRAFGSRMELRPLLLEEGCNWIMHFCTNIRNGLNT